jgi:paraquat-inducible protein B
MVADIDVAAREVSKLTREAGANVPQISQGALDAIKQLNQTLVQAETSLGTVQNTLGDRSPLQFQMSQALTEITGAASALRVLVEYLQENPGALVSGKGALR